MNSHLEGKPVLNMPESMKKIWRSKITKPTATNLKLIDGDMTVLVSDVPDNAIAIQLSPEGKSHIKMVAQKFDYRKSCDFLIFIFQNNKTDIYFIEMKQTYHVYFDKEREHACQQIISTLPIVEYLRTMAEIHCSAIEEINKHFVVVFEKVKEGLDKQITKPKTDEEREFKKRKIRIFYSATIPLEKLKCQKP